MRSILGRCVGMSDVLSREDPMKASKFFRLCAAAFACGVMFSSANAVLLYENSAGSDMASFDLTGAQVKNYTQTKGNGRGVVVVGDVVYYTTADSGNVYKRKASDNTDLGVAFTVAGANGLQAITYDGTDFWVGDYSGTTKAYLVNSSTGALKKTITLSGTGTGIEGFYDGLEYFNGKLIANKYDGGFARAGGNQYSVYDLDGNVLTANFINTNGHGNGTGIAFDGSDFYIADIFNNKISKWNGTTGAYMSNFTLQGSHNFVEDLSFDFAGRVDTCGGPNQPPCIVPGIPEPSTYALMGLGLAGIGFAARRRKTSL